MSKSWHNIETDLVAEKHAADFWSRHRNELQSGEFWADRIKLLRGEPVKRLAVALENMPLPASFREAAIAARALIRDKRKQKAPYDEELALLYWLAAINSFSIPYSKVLEEPGYNVIASIPGKKLKGLPFSYCSLGYEKLELLNKTDITWITESWGKPNKHTTLHEMHNDVWVEYELKLKNKRKQEGQEFLSSASIGAITKHSLPKPPNVRKKSKSTKLVAITVIILALIISLVLGS